MICTACSCSKLFAYTSSWVFLFRDLKKLQIRVVGFEIIFLICQQNISMAERNTDVTTFYKTFQEQQKTVPCDP